MKRSIFDLSAKLKSALASRRIHNRRTLPLNAQTRSSIPRVAPLRIEEPSRISVYPASPGQQRMWFLDQFAHQSEVYCVPSALELHGSLNVPVLEAAFRAVIQRHDVLRTTFGLENGQLVQRVSPESEFQLRQLPLDGIPEEDRGAALERHLLDQIRRPFDLRAGTPLRALLFRLDSNSHVLLITLHHISTDGWSTGLIWNDLEIAYSSILIGRPPAWSELPIQYADYAVWNCDRLRHHALDEDLAYWKQNLEGLSPLELPTDRPHHAAIGSEGAQWILHLPQPLAQGLRELGREEGTTLFMTLLAAFQVLLYRYCGQEDIAVGTPISGRSRRNLESLIGFFVNTLVLRGRIAGDLSFREVLARTKECALAAYTHQHLPFQKLVEELAPARSTSPTPLFQVMFVLESTTQARVAFAGMPVKTISLPVPGSKFDLMLSITDTGTQLSTSWDYSPDLFEASTIARMAQHFETLLRAIVADPQQRVGGIALLSVAERHQLLSEWNPIDYTQGSRCLIPDRFEAQVEKTPAAVALRFEDQCLSYHALNAQANQLAHYLRRLGVQRGTLVGICVERSPAMVVSLLGILKAGGAYVPLDPSYPRARLESILEDTRLPIIVAQSKSQSNLGVLETRLVCLDSAEDELTQESVTNLPSVGMPEDPAYLNYTSGSTGRPKGVLIPHRGVVRLVDHPNYVSLGPETSALHASPLSFDASTFELWGALLNGGCVTLMPPGKASLSDLGEVIQQYRINTLWLTAGLFHLMVEHQLESLKPVRQLIAGGDVLSPEIVFQALRALPDCRLINGYGPTENTTFTCCHTITSEDELAPNVPIGRPISQTQVYILDDSREPVPVGVEGELYAGGEGVALGYLNQPELTAERFIPDSFRAIPGARLYRTGDRGRWRPDGTIEFRGRRDQQVKIRGFRVELGELETTLASCPGVAVCAAIAEPDPNGGRSLAVFLTPKEQAPLPERAVRSWLEERLPDYLIPSRIEFRSRLPLTPSGKVDRQALAAEPKPCTEPVRQLPPPTDPLELHLVRLWSGALAREHVDVDANFFELGGHSMLAMRLFSELEAKLNVRLPLATLFHAPTISRLARVIREKGWTPPWQTLVPIQKHGGRPPLFVIHGIGGNVLGFRDLAIHLGEDQPVFGVQSVGLDGQAQPLDSIEKMAETYLREIFARQPEGPYHVCGLSFGGNIAFELAQQLHRAGHQVGLLALLDTHPLGHTELLPARERAEEYLRSWRTRLQGHLADLSKLEDWRVYLQQKARTIKRRLKSRLWQWQYKQGAIRGTGLPLKLQDVREANTLAARRYVTKPYPGKVVLFLAAEQAESTKNALRQVWSRIALGGLEVNEVPGDHVTLIKPPHVGILARRLRVCFDAVSSERSRGVQRE